MTSTEAVLVEPRFGRLTQRRLPIVLAVLLLWAAWMSKVDIRLLLSPRPWHSLADFLWRLFPPDLSPPFLSVAWHATWATAATALAATAVASFIALPLGVFASSRLWRTGITATGGIGWSGRIVTLCSWLVLNGMALVRSVPDLVWALLFVAGLGLGPLAGTLALIVSYGALLGRVYADIFDEADERPLEALQALGATRFQIFVFGVLPQSSALLISYTLYSFECAIRSAAVLGFVGAGGLGYEISLSMRLFEFPQVLTLLICFLVLLLVVDVVSRIMRAQLSTNTRLAVSSRAGFFANRQQWIVALILTAAFFLCLGPAGITASNLLQNDATRNLLRFARSLLTPDLSASFLAEIGILALQTISISIIGNAGGTILGFLLAIPASRLRPARHESLDRSRPLRLRSETLFWSARMVLNLLRAIPEIVWVLICVIAVGFGPFAGCIALGLHTAGVLGKLFAETMEEQPQEQVEALLAFGANRLQCMFWALIPMSWPMMRRYILLRWDMNLRAATILGLVGAGGLGQALYNDVQLGDYGKVSTLIAVVVVLVISTDWLTRSSAFSEMLTE